MRLQPLTSALLLGLLAGTAAAQADEPQGDNGIAARYPGDRGIGKDPDVVFAEDFEQGSLQALFDSWEDVKARETLSFSAEAPPGSAGRQSLLITHRGGEGTGGHLYRRLLPGYEKLYCRMYVRFDPVCGEIHHFGTNMGGNIPATRWPMVSAGRPTAGDKSFWVGIEPYGRSWVWDYYAYWIDMRGSPPRGQTWGNSFIRDPSLKVERGKWICVEFMIKLNDVGDSNGELACWIDGKLVSHLGKGFPSGTWTYDKFHPGRSDAGIRWDAAAGKGAPLPGGKPFEGFRWRTSAELKINYVWAYLYMTRAPAGSENRVWFDGIVAARKYVGPLKKG